MGVGGGRDEDGVDLGIVQRFIDGAKDLRAEFVPHFVSGLGEHVVDADQFGARVGLDVAGMHPADTAAAQYCETDHYSSP